jgi:hypothetical protein
VPRRAAGSVQVPFRVLQRAALLLAATLASLGLAACEPEPTRYDLAVFGDVPYGSSAIAKYDRMIADINGQDIAFSSHVGDIGASGSATCTDTVLNRETNRFDTLDDPLVYTPGDNEWTDCGSAGVQLNRLSAIRQTVFRGTGTQSRGRTTIALESQGGRGYPENTRWQRGPVTFGTLHVVGSSDNRGVAEHGPRRQATIDWLRETFDDAEERGNLGVVLLAQRDPNLTGSVTSAYRSMHDAVLEEVADFDGEVLFVSGDAHNHLQLDDVGGLENFRWVRVEGDSRVSYVRITVDTEADDLFDLAAPKRF